MVRGGRKFESGNLAFRGQEIWRPEEREDVRGLGLPGYERDEANNLVLDFRVRVKGSRSRVHVPDSGLAFRIQRSRYRVKSWPGLCSDSGPGQGPGVKGLAGKFGG